MKSVSAGASKKVHFWLIENFLSPQFKDMVPSLCEHYGYNVSYVSYKWPRWVWPQTEKQRIIWAYKILFLDVLFPLKVKKVRRRMNNTNDDITNRSFTWMPIRFLGWTSMSCGRWIFTTTSMRTRLCVLPTKKLKDLWYDHYNCHHHLSHP